MSATYAHMHDAGAGWWVLMTFGWLAVVGLGVWAVTSLGRHQSAPSAREVLDRRLADGEITVEEYEHLRETLGAGAAGPTPSHPHP